MSIINSVNNATAMNNTNMGCAPRNPAPRKRFLAWIVTPSGCHCADAFGGTRYRRVPTPLRSTFPFSDVQELLGKI